MAWKIFDFECNDCKAVAEEFVTLDQVVRCRVCNGETTKQLGATRSDWAHMGTDPAFPGAYSKWAKAKTHNHKFGKDSMHKGKGTSLKMY